MITLPVKVSAMLILLLTSSHLWAQSCIAVAGTRIDPNIVYDTRHQCGTCAGQREKPLLCGAINRMMVPFWSASADVVGIPERGYWGRPTANDAPEGTLKAAKEALKAGYRIMRFSVFFTGLDAHNEHQLLTGRFKPITAYGGPAGKYVWDYPPESLVAFNVRKRDQSRSFEADERLVLFSELLKWAADNQVLLVVDPVSGYASAQILELARSTGALANLALRSDVRGYWQTMQSIRGHLPNLYSAYEGRFLWQPPVNSVTANSWNETRILINDWHTNTAQSKQVLAYQAYLYSDTHWSTLPLSDGGRSYSNLIEYIKELTPTGKRTSMWTLNTMGDKGWLHSDYRWNFLANTAADTRGSPWRNLAYKFATHLAIISDRPEWYEGMTENPYPQ